MSIDPLDSRSTTRPTEPLPAALCRSFRGPRRPARAEGIGGASLDGGDSPGVWRREESGWAVGLLRACRPTQLPSLRVSAGLMELTLRSLPKKASKKGRHTRPRISVLAAAGKTTQQVVLGWHLAPGHKGGAACSTAVAAGLAGWVPKKVQYLRVRTSFLRFSLFPRAHAIHLTI